MPIFDNHCEDCGITFEALILAKSDEDIVCCPKCESRNFTRLVSLPNMKVKVEKPGLDLKRGRAHNPFDGLVLQNVRDEKGKPLKVNSERELRAAEKKYNFIHHASYATTQEQLDTPPTHEKWAGDVRHDYKWKWAPPERRDDFVGVSAGSAPNANATLVNRPNSNKRVGT